MTRKSYIPLIYVQFVCSSNIMGIIQQDYCVVNYLKWLIYPCDHKTTATEAKG